MANEWLQRRVFHWAHQGGARENPSNTLRAMRHALAVGAHGLEFDVHATYDGVLVVAHDDTLDRMTGSPGQISKLPLVEVQQRDPAYNWVPGKVDDPDAPPEQYVLRGKGPADPELRIPTLASILIEFPHVPMNFELKAKGYEKVLADTLAEHGRTTEAIVVSFSDRIIGRFKRTPSAAGVPTAPGRVYVGLFWLVSRLGIPALGLPAMGHTALQVPDRLFGLRVADGRLVRAAHRRRLAVHVWTVDDPDRMHAVLDAGADGIMTDRPSALAAVLAERGDAWSPPR